MIFYFTGTGNSLMAAKQIAKETGDELINISECIKNGKYSFTTKKDEKVGFVFPVYYYTIPSMVKIFIEKLELNHKGYTYALITCGGSISGAGGMLNKNLKTKGINLDQVYSVVMPDNAVLYYNVDTEEKTNEIIKNAKSSINEIITLIKKEDTASINSSILSNVGNFAYSHMNKTKKFYTTDKCISCGICAKNCPDEAIEIIDKKVKWVKSRCSKCSACINRCPVRAIEYGSKTNKRNRYVNPILK
ncbi:EFR1 family ferrodoxin [Terrisporobacter sp.]